MGRFIVLIFVIVVGVLVLLARSNTGMTIIQMPWPIEKEYSLSIINLIIISSASGALVMLLIMVIRDTKRLVATYQFQKKQKREEKIRGLYTKAMNAILADDSPEAKKLLEEILKEEPSHAEALMRLGDLTSKEGQHDEAVRHYKKALSVSPGNLAAMFSLAALSEKLEQWTDALEYIGEILEKDPGNHSARLIKRSVLERTASWDEIVDVQKGIVKAEQKAGRDAGKEEAVLTGYRYEAAKESLDKGQVEKAGKAFKNIIRNDERFVPAYLGAAEVGLKEGDSEGAVSFLEKGYSVTSSPLILAKLEDVLINMSEPSRLIRLYRSAMATDPQNSMLRFFLGKLYYRLEMVDDALETLGSGDIPERFPQWNQLLGELHLRRNQCELAVEEFKKTIDFKRTLRIPYCCSKCGHPDEEWSGRCPSCGIWNTYEFNLHGTCNI
jgi:lipopolysaccharide biosynthesis regulator YciM